MTGEQVQGLVRHVLTTFGGMLVARGVFTESVMMEAVGAIATLAGIVWSYWNKRQKQE